MNLNYIYWYEQNLNNKKAQIFYFNFIVYASTFIIKLFYIFSNTSNPTNENLQTCTFNKYEFSNYFEKGKNIQLVPKDIYIFPKQKILNVLGKYFHMM